MTWRSALIAKPSDETNGSWLLACSTERPQRKLRKWLLETSSRMLSPRRVVQIRNPAAESYSLIKVTPVIIRKTNRPVEKQMNDGPDYRRTVLGADGDGTDPKDRVSCEDSWPD